MQLPNLDKMSLLAATKHADELAKAARKAWLANRTQETQLYKEYCEQLQDALFTLSCRLHGMAMNIGNITVAKAWAVVNG